MKIWVLIPAYNEYKTLEGLLKNLQAKGFSVLVVDDGSTDNTYSLAVEYAQAVIKNEKNLGKGRSLKKGIDYLLANTDFDYVIIMDADGQHSWEDLAEFLKRVDNKEYFVVGNRMSSPGAMPWDRVLTNKFMSWFISRITGQFIPDTQCGFRLIKREVLEKVKLETKKFEIESELLVNAARNGFKITSMPIKSIYFKTRKSRIDPFLDTLRFIRYVFTIKK
jgi:glycosyltransferase involved in cell wall biosynthesis